MMRIRLYPYPFQKKNTLVGTVVWDCSHFCRAFDMNHLTVRTCFPAELHIGNTF